MFSERLKKARTAKEKSKEHVAECLGISPRQYQRYEKGEQEPRFESLAALARLLGVSTDYLLGLTDYPAPAPSQSPDAETWRIISLCRTLSPELRTYAVKQLEGLADLQRDLLEKKEIE